MTEPSNATQPPGGGRTLLWTIGGALVLLVVMLYQVGVFSGGEVRPGLAPLPPDESEALGTHVVAASAVPRVYTAVGTVRSRDKVELAARVLARIVEVAVRSGDRVAKDDLLVRLDDTDLRAAALRGEAGLAAAQAAVEAARERVNEAQAAYDLAATERGRMRELQKSGVASRQQLDEAESRYRQTRSAVNQALGAQRRAEAEVAAAAQQLRQAEAILAYTVIRSPIDGVVAERMVDPGDLASPGTLLLRIFDPKRLLLEAPVRESLVREIAVGAAVPFDVPALGRTFAGEVREIVPAVDPRSRTFLVKICLGESDELMPGMFGRMRLPLGTESAILVPAAAVLRTGQVEYVRVRDEGEARTRRVLVRTAEAPDGQRRVLAGLEPGDTLLYRQSGESP